MKLDGKVKGGLAWAGLVVILAVPAANMVVGKSDGGAARSAVTADAGATKPALKVPALKAAATDPIQTASAAGDTAVDNLLAKGKKLPSYISDGGDVTAPKPTTPAPVALKPVAPQLQPVKPATDVAIVAPAETAPVPLPRTSRPKVNAVASLPAAEKPLILDEKKVKQQDAAIAPFPLSDGNVVTSDQLEEWDSGSLADYLERKGLLSKTSAPASGSQAWGSQAPDSYDPDGFYLDEGPNNRPKRPQDDFFLF